MKKCPLEQTYQVLALLKARLKVKCILLGRKSVILVRSGTPEENVVNFLDISLRKVHKKGCYFDDD